VVEAADEPGLLHTVSVAFANAGVSVHAASVTTGRSEAIDTFELTDRNGAKLDAATKARLAEIVAVGVRTRRRRVMSSG
jgi:UTP:GlnB (protein PII) uridylyltransferase